MQVQTYPVCFPSGCAGQRPCRRGVWTPAQAACSVATMDGSSTQMGGAQVRLWCGRWGCVAAALLPYCAKQSLLRQYRACNLGSVTVTGQGVEDEPIHNRQRVRHSVQQVLQHVPLPVLIACLLGCPACLPVCLSADIPQASKSDNMCSIKATRAGAHPVHLRQGLIWVWPEGGTEAAAEAAATPAVVAPQLDDPR